MFGLSTVKRKKQAKKHAETQRIIAEIHNSFETASDRALEEARRILGIDIPRLDMSDEVSMLKRAGFSNTTLVKNYKAQESANYEAVNKCSAAKKRADIVQAWAVKYPQYKFIFMDQVTDICKKYGLVCGSVERYKGDVPKKNILEISKFKVKGEDIYFRRSYNDRYRGWSEKEMNLFDKSEFVSTDEKMRQEQPYKPEPIDYSQFHTDMGYRSFMRHSAKENPHSYIEVPFYICAPLSDMDVSPNTKQKGVFLQDVPDPIVLHYVKDGFLIVSKWGLEGDDPSLVNENMN